MYHTAVHRGGARQGDPGPHPQQDGRAPGGRLHPAVRRHDAALDVTVTHPLQQGHLAGAAATAGHSLILAYNRKVAGVAKAKARHTGDLEEVICRRSWQKLGLLVQKGNCALFNNRVPDVDKQDDK